MSEPYLILHRVRGQPAFDIANCIEVELTSGEFEEWWIIPTSGHRAYPYWHSEIKQVGECEFYFPDGRQNILYAIPLPPNWPDHYPTTASPHTPDPSAPSLAQRLGLVKKAPVITRRL